MRKTLAERFDLLQEDVEAAVIVEIPVGRLVDAAGKGKSGCHVRHNIERILARRNLGHFPRRLPKQGHEIVTLYSEATLAGQLFAAGRAAAELERDRNRP